MEFCANLTQSAEPDRAVGLAKQWRNGDLKRRLSRNENVMKAQLLALLIDSARPAAFEAHTALPSLHHSKALSGRRCRTLVHDMSVSPPLSGSTDRVGTKIGISAVALP